MKLNTFHFLLILLLISSNAINTLIVPTAGQELTVGVKFGDWFKYDMKTTWISDKPEAMPPVFPSDENEMDWMLNNVTLVTDTLIGYKHIHQYLDDTEEINDMISNIEGILTQHFIPSNLTEGDVVNLGWSVIQIEETQLLNYGGSVREINYANETISSYASPLIPYQNNVSAIVHFYWDKQTGVISESNTTVSGTIENNSFNYSFSRSFIIVDSSYAEIVPEFPSWIILPLFLITTILALTVRRRINRNN